MECELALHCSHQRTRVTRHRFPRGYLPRQMSVAGFRTGDIVHATVPTGKHAGTWVGRVAVRTTGSFNIQTENAILQGISWKSCRVVQRADGYGYHLTRGVLTRPSSLDST